MGTGNPRGRPPKPAPVKLLEGNPGKRRINPEYQPTKAGPDFEAPAWLKGEGRREWVRLVREMSACGMLSTIDRNALASYCALFGRWTECEWMLRREGMVTPKGEPSPWIQLARSFRAEMRPYESEFGMTPIARTRIANAPKILSPQNSDSPRQSNSTQTKTQAKTPAIQAGNLSGLIGRVN